MIKHRVLKNEPGYLVVEAKCVDCDDAKNAHVIKVRIDQDEEGHRQFQRDSKSTICGESLLPGKIGDGRVTNTYLESESRDLRSKLAELQNSRHEICGVCVSHFYADYVDE